MTPVDERENENITTSSFKAKTIIKDVVSSFDELLKEKKVSWFINDFYAKKPRNKMKHLTPKKKKRKK